MTGTRRFSRLLAPLVAAVIAGAAMPALAQDGEEFAVLVYSHTTGFRHLSIEDGVAAIEGLGVDHGFAVEHTEDPAIFTDADLARFDAVIFLNTTGDVMTDDGRAAFERYVRDGGGWVGVHSAADTEYDWPFYGELLAGAWFLSHPVQQPGVILNEAPDHASTAHLPDEWLIPFEEFYSFIANPRERTRVLLAIDEDSYLQDPNTTNLPPPEFEPPEPGFWDGETGVMGDHPMSWCHGVGDGVAWYTALGHESWLYYWPDYLDHLLGGILTAAGQVDTDCVVAADAGPVEAGSATDSQDGAADGADDQGNLPATGWLGGIAALAALAAAAAVAMRRIGTS
jgi:uncharacterized protein